MCAEVGVNDHACVRVQGSGKTGFPHVVQHSGFLGRGLHHRLHPDLSLALGSTWGLVGHPQWGHGYRSVLINPAMMLIQHELDQSFCFILPAWVCCMMPHEVLGAVPTSDHPLTTGDRLKAVLTEYIHRASSQQ